MTVLLFVSRVYCAKVECLGPLSLPELAAHLRMAETPDEARDKRKDDILLVCTNCKDILNQAGLQAQLQY